MTDRMLLPSQLGGQSSSALAYPAQGGFGIAPRFRFNQTIQRGEKLGIAHDNALPARARSANTSRYTGSLFYLAYPLGNGFS